MTGNNDYRVFVRIEDDRLRDRVEALLSARRVPHAPTVEGATRTSESSEAVICITEDGTPYPSGERLLRIEVAGGAGGPLLLSPSRLESGLLASLLEALAEAAFARRRSERLESELEEIRAQLAERLQLAEAQNAALADANVYAAEQMELLDEQSQRLEAAEKTRSLILANISHEFRTPLNAIVGMVALLEDGKLDAEDKKRLHTIAAAARSLLRLVQNLLDVARSEDGGARLTPAAFDIRVQLVELYSVIEATNENARLRISLDVDPDVPALIESSPGAIQQIVLTVVDNALKFTAEGEVAIRVSYLRRSASSETLRIAVSDSGPGIAPELLSELTEPFRQAEYQLSRSTGGVGIGLTLVRKLVSQLGGSLDIANRTPHGLEVTVDIPCGVHHEEAEGEGRPLHFDSTPSVDPRPAGSRRILVVDDLECNREIVVRILRRLGYDAESASDGFECLALLVRTPHRWDAILMDVGMPGIDGIQTVRRLRDAGSSVPIMAVTGHATAEVRAECLAAGMDAVLEKPFSSGDLNAALEALLCHAPGAGR